MSGGMMAGWSRAWWSWYRTMAAAVGVLGIWQAVACAQETRANVPSAVSAWELILAGGLTGVIIIALSLVALALVVHYFLTIRKGVLLPDDLLVALNAEVGAGRPAEAAARCRSDGSLIARVIAAGLRERTEGPTRVRQAMEDAGDDEVLRLQRRLSYLSLIGTVTPMLGLYGTVIGMIRAFNVIAQKAGVPRPSELAGGISQALVTTWLGLFVAIPATFFYGIFLNRVSGLALEAGELAEEVMAPLLHHAPGQADPLEEAEP